MTLGWKYSSDKRKWLYLSQKNQILCTIWYHLFKHINIRIMELFRFRKIINSIFENVCCRNFSNWFARPSLDYSPLKNAVSPNPPISLPKGISEKLILLIFLLIRTPSTFPNRQHVVALSMNISLPLFTGAINQF